MRRALCTPPGSPTWLDRQLPVGGGLVGRILLPRGVGGLGLRVGLLFGENAVQARLEARDGAVPPAFPAHFVLLGGVVSLSLSMFTGHWMSACVRSWLDAGPRPAVTCASLCRGVEVRETFTIHYSFVRALINSQWQRLLFPIKANVSAASPRKSARSEKCCRGLRRATHMHSCMRQAEPLQHLRPTSDLNSSMSVVPRPRGPRSHSL
jgi:hypothetical protein